MRIIEGDDPLRVPDEGAGTRWDEHVPHAVAVPGEHQMTKCHGCTLPRQRTAGSDNEKDAFPIPFHLYRRAGCTCLHHLGRAHKEEIEGLIATEARKARSRGYLMDVAISCKLA